MTEKKGERIAKVIARAGLCSRRDAEKLIAEGRVLLDGKKLDTAAVTVGPANIIRVDGKVLPKPEPPRLYRYHKPRGRVTTSRDPEGRPTIYDDLPKGLPRLQPVGRLDLNSEGLLLLTNDGGLKRQLELPSSALVRRYRVRVYGQVDEERLAGLQKGTVIDGFSYGPIEAEIERRTGTNTWLIMALQPAHLTLGRLCVGTFAALSMVGSGFAVICGVSLYFSRLKLKRSRHASHPSAGESRS